MGKTSTSWKPGFCPNPAGKPKGPTLSGTLRRLIKKRREDGRRDLDDIAQVLIDMAKARDLDAIEVIFDRLEGKVTEKRELSGANGGRIEADVVIHWPEDE